MRRFGSGLVAAAVVACALGPADAAGPAARMLGPGVVSTPANEFGGSSTPDGRELYYSMSVPRSYMYAIFMSRRTARGWSAPVLAPFSGRGRDFDPVISPDGRRMMFISDRPTAPGRAKHDYDIWTVERQGSGWGAPVHLDAPINRDGGEGDNEWFASLAADGTLYFAADVDQADADLFRSRLVAGRYQPPENLGPVINAPGVRQSEPMIAPDQSFLLFSMLDAPGGHGDWDIWISRRQADGGWSAPVNLGPQVNTPQRDYSPRLQPDGHSLIFTSERYFATGATTRLTYARFRAGALGLLNGDGNLYSIDLAGLGVLP